MLSVYLGDCENEIYNPPLYFIINMKTSGWNLNLLKQ